MKKKQIKSVKNTTPKWFKTPFGHLSYVLIQNPDQFNNFKDKVHHELADMIKAEYLKDSDFTAITIHASKNSSNEYLAIIYFPDLLNHPEDRAITVLCHESVHVWQEFSENMIAEKYPSREFEAYTIDEVFGNVLQEYRRLKSIHRRQQAKKLKSKTKLKQASCPKDNIM